MADRRERDPRRQFRARKIADSQQISWGIREAGIGKYQPATPGKYTSEEGYTEGTPKLKGEKPKRIRQAYGRE